MLEIFTIRNIIHLDTSSIKQAINMTRNQAKMLNSFIYAICFFFQFQTINADQTELILPTRISAAPSCDVAPTPVKMCENWCASHPTPWTEKCHWPGSCGGCSECSSVPETNCKPWCENHPKPWRDPEVPENAKCNWQLNCAGCQECSDSEVPVEPPSETKMCKSWCADHITPFKHPNPNVKQKCQWLHECGGCPECSEDPPQIPPSDEPMYVSSAPIVTPNIVPSVGPSSAPSIHLDKISSISPSYDPTAAPSMSPSNIPSLYPTTGPNQQFFFTVGINGCSTLCFAISLSWPQKCALARACGSCRQCFNR